MTPAYSGANWQAASSTNVQALGNVLVERVFRALQDPLADRYCPRHGTAFVLRRGTNRCPIGRKRKVNCR